MHAVGATRDGTIALRYQLGSAANASHMRLVQPHLTTYTTAVRRHESPVVTTLIGEPARKHLTLSATASTSLWRVSSRFQPMCGVMVSDDDADPPPAAAAPQSADSGGGGSCTCTSGSGLLGRRA
jgi:hypothetical protein